MNFPLKKISEIFEVGSSKRVHKADWKNSGVPFYRAREVVKLAENGMVDNDLYISEELYNEFSEKYGVPSSGDILVSAVGTIGECYVIQDNDRFYFKDASVICFKKKEEVNSEFIKYAFKSDYVRDQIMANSMGATVRTYTIGRAKKTKVPFPPLPEQKRIVAKLDEAFEAIEQARANIERNIENAEELFQSKLNEIFSQSGEGWEEVKLADVYNFKNGLNFTKDEKNEVDGEGVLTIDVYNMYRGGLTVDLNELYRVDKEVKDSYLLKKGDILFVRSSLKKEGVAWTTYFTEHDEDVSYCGFIIRGRPKEDLNPEYSVYYCRSPRVRNELINRSVQSTITNINQKLLSDVDIPIPSKIKQAEIVKELKQFESYKNEIVSNYEKRLESLNELKKSILQKAFSGELTANETVAV